MNKTQDFLLTLLGLFLLGVLVVVIVVLGIKTQRMQVDMPGGGQVSGKDKRLSLKLAVPFQVSIAAFCTKS